MFQRIPWRLTGLALLTLGSPAPVAGTAHNDLSDRKVIRWGHDIPDATYAAEHAAEMERTGFDGIAINFTKRFKDPEGNEKEERVRSQWISASPISLDEIRHNVDALKGAEFRRFTDNFLIMYANNHHGPEMFFRWAKEEYPDSSWPAERWPKDPDQHLNTFRQNMRLAAQVSKDVGLKGFMIDFEGYGSWRQMRIDWPEQVFGQDKQTLVDRARRNVAGVFRDVCQVCPDITILLLPGIYYSHREEPSLERAFVDGILTGVGEGARVFDMQEQAYDLFLYKRFVDLREESRRTGLKHSDVPELLDTRMKYGFGVWLDHRSRGRGGFFADQVLNHFTAWELGNALHYALTVSDGYVWVYGENSVMWSAGTFRDAKPNVPEAYLEAIRTCRRPRALDLGRDTRGAESEELPPPSASIKTAGDTFGTAAPDLELVAELNGGWEIFFDHEDRTTWSYQDPLKGLDSVPWLTIRVGEFWERQGHAYNGAAVYRRKFTLSETYAGRDIYLVLGGLGNKCHVYLNGGWAAGVWQNAAQRKTEHDRNVHEKTSRTTRDDWQGGQRPYDLGPAVLKLSQYAKPQFGKENVLTVYVINGRGPGGLWKPVWIAAGRPDDAQQRKAPEQD